VHDVERAVSMLRRLSSDMGLARLRVREQMDQLVALTESRIDALTGVANRRAFDEELESLVARNTRTGKPVALALVDLDQFKAINDALGHPTGDTVLREAALAMVENGRATDFVARTGGDEFGILMEETDLGDANSRAERVRAAVQEVTDRLAGTGFDASVTAGVAALKPNESPASLVARADAALYCCKTNRRPVENARDTLPPRAADGKPRPGEPARAERSKDPVRS
jgi:diguanylate cyclase (GGDEF)-like protein